MSSIGSVRSTVTVSLDPERAFDAFTGDIDTWYRRGASTMHAAGPGAGFRIEPGVGGRLVESPDPSADGSPAVERERGRVTVWEPGVRLVFVDHRETEVEVRFELIDGGSRVVLEHRGLDRLPEDVAARLAKYGWQRMAQWFEWYVDNLEEP